MFRSAAAVMAALFALSAAVQWNDPDPAYWMALYGLACVLAVLAAAGRLPVWPNVTALALFSILAAIALPDLVAGREQAFTHWHMLASQDETAREAGGLSICALWSAVQVGAALRARRAKRSE